MSVYHPSFNLLGRNSHDDYNLIITHFDADNGECDTWLGMDPIYSESVNGTHRIDYGAKFNDVAKPKITLIKSDGSDFTTQDVRNFLKWTTGHRQNSYLELCEWNEDEGTWNSKFRFLGRVTSAYQQKLDSRTIGVVVEFTTISPFAYSPIQIIEAQVDGNAIIETPHDSDDLDTLVYLDVEFTNTGEDQGSLSIISGTMQEPTEVNGLLVNETITLNSNGFIMSDSGRILGSGFNYIFPTIGYKNNMRKVDNISVTGHGNIVLKYVYFIKIGDCTIDSEISNGSMCGCTGSDSTVCTVNENELNAMLKEILI